jgi:hypothetical protein
MSVNSVSTGLSPSYSPLSANNSRTAKSAALGKQLPENTLDKADVSYVTSAEVDSATQDASVTSGDPADVGQFQSTLEQALREGGATAGKSTSGASGSPGTQSSHGIALYQRVSQYGNNGPSNSALFASWNKIMQGGEDADSAAAAFVKAFSQNETPGSASGVLDLTV